MSDWKSMDSAPKDGTFILTFHPNKGQCVMQWHQPANPNARGFWTMRSHNATPECWKPLGPDPK